MTEHRYRLVVFDFDGTLCDSADVKTDAFYKLYLNEYGAEFAAEVRAYHLANAGVSRYDKIRYIERELIGRHPNDERIDEVAERFSQLVEDAVVEAPLFTGVQEFLSTIGPDTPLMIASATPTTELRRIVDRKQISRFFDEIEGSPRSKSEILMDFTARYEVVPDRIVMVGDQPSDARGAREAGTDALLITPPASWVAPFTRVDTFSQAASWLEEHLAPPI